MQISIEKDALTILNNTYSDFHHLLLSEHGNNESFRNFKSGFAATIAKKHLTAVKHCLNH